MSANGENAEQQPPFEDDDVLILWEAVPSHKKSDPNIIDLTNSDSKENEVAFQVLCTEPVFIDLTNSDSSEEVAQAGSSSKSAKSPSSSSSSSSSSSGSSSDADVELLDEGEEIAQAGPSSKSAKSSFSSSSGSSSDSDVELPDGAEHTQVSCSCEICPGRLPKSKLTQLKRFLKGKYKEKIIRTHWKPDDDDEELQRAIAGTKNERLLNEFKLPNLQQNKKYTVTPDQYHDFLASRDRVLDRNFDDKYYTSIRRPVVQRILYFTEEDERGNVTP
jgi:hypothetical protein